MPVQVTDNTPELINAFTQRASTFLRVACDALVDEATPNTPKKEGNLSRDVLKTVGGLKATVEWRKVYASVQEQGSRSGIPFRHYTTPGTGPKFAENAANRIAGMTGNIAKIAHLI